MTSIKYYPLSTILICYPASFGRCVRIPVQKMTNGIPMTMVWGSESRYDGWNQNEHADQKERPRRKMKRTHSFVDRLHWVCLRLTPYNSCLGLCLPSLVTFRFQMSWSRASGFLYPILICPSTVDTSNPHFLLCCAGWWCIIFCSAPPLSGDYSSWCVGG